MRKDGTKVGNLMTVKREPLAAAHLDKLLHFYIYTRADNLGETNHVVQIGTGSDKKDHQLYFRFFKREENWTSAKRFSGRHTGGFHPNDFRLVHKIEFLLFNIWQTITKKANLKYKKINNKNPVDFFPFWQLERNKTISVSGMTI